MYISVLISSVKGARKATFFAAGNIGRDRANDRRLFWLRGIGPFVRIDVMLYASLYGHSAGKESTVETDAVDTADEEVISGESEISVRRGVGMRSLTGVTDAVDKGVRAGFRAPGALSDACGW